MTSRVIHTFEDADRLAAFLKTRDLPVTATITKGDPRTKAQNRLVHRWFGDIAAQDGDKSPADVKAECNLIYGRPIMARDFPDWTAAFGYLFDSLSWEAKVKAIRVLDVPFTRRMNVKQLCEYMDQMERDYTELGISLTQPERESA